MEYCNIVYKFLNISDTLALSVYQSNVGKYIELNDKRYDKTLRKVTGLLQIKSIFNNLT